MDIEKHIIQRKHLYFGDQLPSADAICEKIEFTARILGATEVAIYRKNGWSIIKSNFDWLYAAKLPREGEGSIWERPWAFPEAAPNTPRFEVMVRIFSERSFSIGGQNIEVIKGEPPSEHEIFQLGLPSISGGRCVAFIFKNR